MMEWLIGWMCGIWSVVGGACLLGRVVNSCVSVDGQTLFGSRVCLWLVY